MIKNKISLILLSLILFGCSTAGNSIIKSTEVPTDDYIEDDIRMTQPKPITSSLPPILITHSVIDYTVDNILYKSFLLPNNIIPEDTFINFIYFPRKPITKKEIDQYVFICKVWSNSLPSEKEAKLHIKKENLIPLYWSLSKPSNYSDCKNLVMNYDYVRMKMFVSENKLSENKVQLLGIYNNVYVSINLTKITKEEDIILSFDVWRDKMSRVPEKSSVLDIFTIVDSAKKVLGVLAGLIITGFKG